MFRSVLKNDSVHRALGVDIGQHAIKTVLLEGAADGMAVRHAARMATPVGAVKNGIVVDRREVASCLRQIERGYGCRVRAASLSVPTEQLVVRWIDLPRMNAEALRAATPFEARKYLPYPVDKAEVVIVPMEQAGDGEDDRMRSLLAAAPRDVVRSRAEALEMAGLEVTNVEMEPFTLLRALSPAGQQGALWRGQPLAYVQLGEESSGMCVVQDTNLRFVHSISWGSRRLTQALAGVLDIAPEEAQAIKEQDDAAINADGIFSWTQDGERRETDVLLTELDRLRREILRLLNYYRSLFPERSYEGILDRVVLSGGLADLNGLDRYFAHSLQVDVAVRNPFQSFASRLLSDSFAAIEGHQTSFVVAVGLALGALQTETSMERSSVSRTREFVWRRKAA